MTNGGHALAARLSATGTDASHELPVAIIGAGPVGLAAAAHLAIRRQSFVLFERGHQPGAAVAQWAHVTFFSPWRHVVDHAARQLLEASGWSIPDPDRDPTGGELIDQYLAPLAALPVIAPHLRLRAQVVSITRQGMDRVPSTGRSERPFELTAVDEAGNETRHLARAIIDASGTWDRPNPAGASGVHAPGERAAASRISYGIPDVFGTQRSRFAGRRVMVIGSGHSAMDSVLGLARLREDEPATTILWAMRSTPDRRTFDGLDDEQLAGRGALGERSKAAVDAGQVRLVAPFRVNAFELGADSVAVTGAADDVDVMVEVDEVIVATGFRPDFQEMSELRLDLHPWLESPRPLGPLIDPNEHSCATVPPHGVDELSHPEGDVYIVGMKSYGRAPTFLMITGYEQVRSVVAALAGDWDDARTSHPVLAELDVIACPTVASRNVAADCCGT